MLVLENVVNSVLSMSLTKLQYMLSSKLKYKEGLVRPRVIS